MGELGAEPVYLQTPPCIALQTTEMNQQGDTRPVAVLHSVGVNDNVFSFSRADGSRGSAP
jgi:hypothetical protein